MILDWSHYKNAGMGDAYADIPKNGGDFARAVSVCINSHQCETLQNGVMCPSYRVSQDPDLSPGGRIRLLKKALNSDNPDSALRDKKLARSMELCVACKGCKRECENEVDIAMIKSEYLASTTKERKYSIRTHIVSHLADYLEKYSMMQDVIAIRNRNNNIKHWLEKILGISSSVELPQPVEKKFNVNCSGSTTTSIIDEVVLLIDTFSHHFRPEAAYAAIEMLNKAGYKVQIASYYKEKKLCCGRTLIAHGKIKKAKEYAQRMLKVLLPYAKGGRKIIGLEPSCLLAIRDDYKFLGLGEEAEMVARQIFLFEEFIAKEITAKRLNVDFELANIPKEKVLVHGHCHQKSVGAMKSMRKILKFIPNLGFDFIESSCCGMAGSFGIEQENSELSQQMAELSLFPSLRDAPEAIVLANGFSCQHQIKQGLNRPSLHISQLLNHIIK